MFSKKEFVEYATKNYVLMEADFPTPKKSQPAALKKANEELKKKYDIEGFPTLLILDSEGKELGREVGYGGGGTKAVIAALDKYRKK